MIRRLMPDNTADSAYQIDYDALYRQGFTGLVFDIDNALVPQDAPADERARELVRHLKDIGFRIVFLSNNTPERVNGFCEFVSADGIAKAGKPLKKGFQKALDVLKTEPEHTLFVGDQLFTDIFGAKKAGMAAILVEPIDRTSDLFLIRIKRFFERIILRIGGVK